MSKLVSELSMTEINNLVAEIEGIDTGPAPNFCGMWLWGGAIIEREKISTIYGKDCGKWQWRAIANESSTVQYGETSLIAAMRCYVASVYGDTVGEIG